MDDVDVILAGHGEPVEDHAELIETRFKMHDRRAAKILKMLDEPRTAHDALHFEAAEAARCIAEGRLESPVRPLAESILTLQVMDEVRRQIGVTFPG